jgi:hypothetical protein
MYIIINKTKQSCTRLEGHFPNLDKQLDRGDRIIIISLYSNTIKVPYKLEYNGITEWDWENYSVNDVVLSRYKSP